MVFDDTYRLLGVIDWETAFAGPYEVSCEFPLSMSLVPPAMDVPWKYDEMGCPKDPDERQKFADRASYIAIVRQKEQERGLTERYSCHTLAEHALSRALFNVLIEILFGHWNSMRALWPVAI